MVNRFIKKLKSSAGETFVEILVAVLTVSLSSTLLVSGVAAANKLNSEAIIMDKQYEADKRSAEEEPIMYGEGGMTFINNGEPVSVSVGYYGDGAIISYSGDIQSSDPEKKTDDEDINPSPAPGEYEFTPFNVFFDANYEGGPVTSQGYIYDPEIKSTLTYGQMPAVSREGYDFAGWYTEKAEGSGTKVEGNTKLVKYSEHTLYAHWTDQAQEIEVTLQYLDQNGTIRYSDPQKIRVGENYGKILGAVNPDQSKNFSFDNKWYYGDQVITDTTSVEATSNHTIVASYSVTVTFICSDCEDKEVKIPRGSKVDKPNDTQYQDKYTNQANDEGEGIYAWYKDDKCTIGNEFDFNNTYLNSNIKLYAYRAKFMRVDWKSKFQFQ